MLTFFRSDAFAPGIIVGLVIGWAAGVAFGRGD
jgi:hypothetical protein